MNVLVVDIGGTNVKVWKTDEFDNVKFRSGKKFTPTDLVTAINEHIAGWKYEAVSMGFPGEVVNGRPAAEPLNLGQGWVEFDFAQAFGCPVRIANDACMQALGSYEGGKMLYLGLGTGIGTAFISDGNIIPLALGHLRFHKGESFDHFISRAGLERYGVKSWRRSVNDAAATLQKAFYADYVVLGGGNAKKLKDLPSEFRRGGNHNAYFGGLRMWETSPKTERPPLAVYPDEPQVGGAP